MILQNGSPSLLSSLTDANPDARAALATIPTALVQRADIVMLMSEMGEPIGFALLAKENETDQRLSDALFGLWLDERVEESYGKVLSNLLRSLRLSSYLIRSDDTLNIKELLHYPIEYIHLHQVYRVVGPEESAPLDKGSSLPASSNRASSTPGTLGTPLVVDGAKLDQVLRLCYGSKTVATVEVYESNDPKIRYLFPSVAPGQRREGFGREMVGAAADLLHKKGITSLLPIDPTDDAARRFAQHDLFESVYDFMRVTPRFHLPPYPVPEEVIPTVRRRRRKSLE